MQRFHNPPAGDLGLIAYTSNRGGSYDIWLYDLSTGVSNQITSGLAESFSVPFWSPNSKRVAFVGKNGILYVVELVDGVIARIDQFVDGLGVYLDWSPDSKKLAYTKQNDIILYNITTHQAKRVNQPGATDVQWFPSGGELLFQAPDSSGVSQLFYIQDDGSGKRQITQNTGGAFNNVRLSPDGSYVLYTTPGVSISIIYTIEISTGNVFEVKGGPLAKNYFPVWSPDSTRIAYSTTAFEDVGYFSLVKVTGRQGEDDRIRAISDCYATPVTWSPDGRKIAYLSGCDNQGIASEMWLFDVLHPVPVQLTEGDFITALQWSPKPICLSKNAYINPVYNVQFDYPSHWQKVTDQRYEGPDGFFQISAISSEETIFEVCQNEAFHQLLPYGSEPRIIHTQIQEQEACFIFPSKDQPPEMRGQAAVIIRYPNPVEIEGATYNYFILWADQGHINEISSTLTFLV
ncbi:hypothetical protein CFK40_14670 [Virgibacillus necropolis]|uniref:TolB protein n=2 Tax=Virgibacillus necropolis TaxID=163877 RepID=A0A221MEV7_9BACI|nr:hypothetical protein CFK40_14670 [Virgibacillus necropolis]